MVQLLEGPLPSALIADYTVSQALLATNKATNEKKYVKGTKIPDDDYESLEGLVQELGINRNLIAIAEKVNAKALEDYATAVRHRREWAQFSPIEYIADKSIIERQLGVKTNDDGTVSAELTLVVQAVGYKHR